MNISGRDRFKALVAVAALWIPNILSGKGEAHSFLREIANFVQMKEDQESFDAVSTRIDELVSEKISTNKLLDWMDRRAKETGLETRVELTSDKIIIGWIKPDGKSTLVSTVVVTRSGKLTNGVIDFAMTRVAGKVLSLDEIVALGKGRDVKETDLGP